MGLDNWISIKHNENTPKCVARCFKKSYDGYEYEVAYWRKCWNVREIIFRTVERYTEENRECEITLTRDDVVKIIKKLQSLTEDTYNSRGGCIWGWKDFRRINRRNIRALKKLSWIMLWHWDLEVYFYDSY